MPPSDPNSPTDPLPITLRSYRPSDHEACQKLYVEGLDGGKLAEDDTGSDIENIPTAYVAAPGSYFWVAEDERGEVVGMIGVQQRQQGIGEIRRLRVRSDCRRRGIGTRLVEAAVAFCLEQAYLKVALDTFVDREPALKLFEKFRFKHSRTKKIGEKDLLYFYLDLYTGDSGKREDR